MAMASNPGKIVVALLLLFLSITVEVSNGAVYKVGDEAGWTTIGNVDYKKWAFIKTFHVGDIIVFEYNPQFHNVMQVTHSEYKTCTVSSPISTHTTGNDSIAITAHGHHFFVCGVPGHCQSGQRVDINVVRAPLVAPSPSVLSPAVPPAIVPAPSQSTTVSPNFKSVGKIGLLFVVLMVMF